MEDATQCPDVGLMVVALALKQLRGQCLRCAYNCGSHVCLPRFEPEATLPATVEKHWNPLIEPILTTALEDKISPRPFTIGAYGEDNWLEIRVQLPDGVLGKLSEVSPREMRKALLDGLGSAVAAGRNKLVPEDLRLRKADSGKRKIGF